MAFERRFHTTCCKRPGSPKHHPRAEVHHDLQANFFASAAGRRVSTAALMTMVGSVGCASRRSFPDIMRDTSSISSMSRACNWTLRYIVSTARATHLFIELAGLKHPRPAEHRVKGGAQLVREHAQELVLGPARCLRLPAAPSARDSKALHALRPPVALSDKVSRYP